MGDVSRIRTQRANPSTAAFRCLPVPAHSGGAAGGDWQLAARTALAQDRPPFDRRRRPRGTRRVPHADSPLAAAVRLYLQHAAEFPASGAPDTAYSRLPRLAGLDIRR